MRRWHGTMTAEESRRRFGFFLSDIGRALAAGLRSPIIHMGIMVRPLVLPTRLMLSADNDNERTA